MSPYQKKFIKVSGMSPDYLFTITDDMGNDLFPFHYNEDHANQIVNVLMEAYNRGAADNQNRIIELLKGQTPWIL